MAGKKKPVSVAPPVSNAPAALDVERLQERAADPAYNDKLAEARAKALVREVPDWVTAKFTMMGGYWLIAEEGSIWVEDIELISDEYLELKAHLARLRGYTVPKEEKPGA